MRVVGLIFIILMFNTGAICAESDHFIFESSGYKFESTVKKNRVHIIWKKSGFVNEYSGVLNPCWKKAVNREVASVGKKLLSPRGKHTFGRAIKVSWNQFRDARHVFPRQMDSLDKRFSFIFNLAKSGENKCAK